jgi:NAD(P)-dependent dehydrogenase (short-subunit alcohol dehydrogenase family)
VAAIERHAAVTGAARGIGRAVAERLARDGWTLSLFDRDQDGLGATAAETGAFSAVCDIRSPAAVSDAFAAAARERGAFDALAAIAGVGGPNEPGAVDRWDELIATNLTGTYNCLRAFEANLADGEGPRHVVVISSILARIGVPGYSGYSASKAGLLGLVRSFAAEWAPSVLVNAICPGWVDTDMARVGLDATGLPREQAYEEAMRFVPLGRMADPEEVAGTVAWLFSPDARSITGQAFDQNGGAFMA